MFGLIPLLIIVILAAVFTSFYSWAKRRGLLAAGPEGQPARRRVPLLTEAVAYVGAILILAGGAAAIGQRWNSLGGWGHAGVYAGGAAFFWLIGHLLRRATEPAIQRLISTAWFLSVVGVAAAAGFLTRDVLGSQDLAWLATGLAATACGGALWLARPRALQNAALFTGLVVTIVGTIGAVGNPGSPVAFATSLWCFGLVWAAAGWRRYVEPMWVTVPCGVLLALIAPSFGAGDSGWLYLAGIATAGAAMAVSVPQRNPALLAMGTLAMFGYVTATVVTYFHRSLGVPAALAITGLLIVGLAAVTGRLMRAAHPPEPRQPGAETPPAVLPPPPAVLPPPPAVLPPPPAAGPPPGHDQLAGQPPPTRPPPLPPRDLPKAS
jgi:hypothetical protein